MVYKIGSVRVITYATEDIHSTVGHRNTLRESSFIITRDPKYMAHTYRSPQTDCDNSADLAFMGDLQIEQAQQLNEALSPLTEFTDQQGFGNALISQKTSLVIPGPLAKIAFFRYYNARATHRAKLLANSENNGELIKFPNRCWNVSGASFSLRLRERNVLFMKWLASQAGQT
ncbi:MULTISPECIES: hypothetical protein [unclassified Pseudomonas]|uniref:hypothetical protein n=1 Tax=unclassified Pseudomonas TaxID=196821 RepID=UPI001CC0F66B|nr:MULTISPECIES: hypothetical protein [unclassified Pseudomonas]